MTTTPERTATLTSLVAAEIRAWMGRLNVRQSELARRMGESDQWMSMRLKGRTPIDLNELQRIANALGIQAVELLPAAFRKIDNTPDQPNDRWDWLLLTDTPPSPDKPPRHAATRPFSPNRTDATRPGSVVPPNRRRPSPVRPGGPRTMPS